MTGIHKNYSFILKATGIFIAIASFSIFVPKVSAANFLATCKITGFSNTRMTAECKDRQGNYRDTGINLDDFVSNHDGYLVFSGDEGNFSRTCKNINLETNGLLTADCLTISQQWKRTSLNLNKRIDNRNGSLVFE